MDIPSYETLSTLIKILSFKVFALPSTFNQTNRSLQPTLPAQYFYNFCKYFSLLMMSMKVCVFYFCIFSSKLDLFKTTCSIMLFCVPFQSHPLLAPIRTIQSALQSIIRNELYYQICTVVKCTDITILCHRFL